MTARLAAPLVLATLLTSGCADTGSSTSGDDGYPPEWCDAAEAVLLDDGIEVDEDEARRVLVEQAPAEVAALIGPVLDSTRPEDPQEQREWWDSTMGAWEGFDQVAEVGCGRRLLTVDFDDRPLDVPRPAPGTTLAPYDAVLSVNALPLEELQALGALDVDAPEQACNHLGLSRDVVAAATGVEPDALQPVVLSDIGYQACLWQVDADDETFDGDGDGKVDVVEAGLSREFDLPDELYRTIEVDRVVSTPGDLVALLSSVSADSGFDPGEHVKIYDLGESVLLSVGVSNIVNDNLDVATQLLDQTIAHVGG